MPDRMFFQVEHGACNMVINIVEKRISVAHKTVMYEHICKRDGLTYIIEISRGFHLKNQGKQPPDNPSDDALDPNNRPDGSPPDGRDYG